MESDTPRNITKIDWKSQINDIFNTHEEKRLESANSPIERLVVTFDEIRIRVHGKILIKNYLFPE